MDAYTLHLLGMAYEVCRERGYSLRLDNGFRIVTVSDPDDPNPDEITERGWGGESVDAACLSLILTDLGVEVPERPSETDVAALALAISIVGGDRVKYLRSCKRLTVLALLERTP